MVVADIVGPTSYTAVSVATPPTGGHVVYAADLGLVEIEHAEVALSDNGQYGARVIHDSTYANRRRGQPQIRLMFFTAATGAEVGSIDLSARTFRIFAIGR